MFNGNQNKKANLMMKENHKVFNSNKNNNSNHNHHFLNLKFNVLEKFKENY
jgi:hypothetical protein